MRNAPSVPKFTGSRASFHDWVDMFGGFARMHGYYDAFLSEIAVPVKEIES